MNSYNLGSQIDRVATYELVSFCMPSIEVTPQDIGNKCVYVIGKQELLTKDSKTFNIIELVSRAKVILGMGKIDVAKHLDISRQTLERHILGKTIDYRIVAKYQFLNDILDEMESRFDTKISSFSGNVIVDGSTFREYFRLGASDLIDKAEKILAKTKNVSFTSNTKVHINRTIGVGKQG